MVDSLPETAPKSVSSPQIATSTAPGTPYWLSILLSVPACFASIDFARPMRGGIMRPENCAKLCLKTCWLRSSPMTWVS